MPCPMPLPSPSHLTYRIAGENDRARPKYRPHYERRSANSWRLQVETSACISLQKRAFAEKELRN